MKPTAAHPAHTHRITEFNYRLGMDVKYLRGWKANQKIPCLNMVDTGSSYQVMAPFFEQETGSVLRGCYLSRWKGWAGPPVEVVLDPANTNLSAAFADPLELEGTSIFQTAGEAHWQLGKTEKHGDLFQRIFDRVLDAVKPQGEAD